MAPSKGKRRSGRPNLDSVTLLEDDAGLTRKDLGVVMADRSTWRRVVADLGPTDRPTDRPTARPTDRPTDRPFESTFRQTSIIARRVTPVICNSRRRNHEAIIIIKASIQSWLKVTTIVVNSGQLGVITLR